MKYATDKVLISFQKFLCHLKPPLAKRGKIDFKESNIETMWK